MEGRAHRQTALRHRPRRRHALGTRRRLGSLARPRRRNPPQFCHHHSSRKHRHGLAARTHALIIEQDNWPLWLGETEGGHADLMRPADPGVVRLWPVSRRVNSVRNTAPNCSTNWQTPARKCGKTQPPISIPPDQARRRQDSSFSEEKEAKRLLNVRGRATIGRVIRGPGRKFFFHKRRAALPRPAPQPPPQPSAQPHLRVSSGTCRTNAAPQSIAPRSPTHPRSPFRRNAPHRSAEDCRHRSQPGDRKPNPPSLERGRDRLSACNPDSATSSVAPRISPSESVIAAVKATGSRATG